MAQTSSRSKYRNVHLFNTSDRSTEIGGLILSNGITNANFYDMVEIIAIFSSNYSLRDDNEAILKRDNSLLQPGNYYIDAPEPFELNNELVLIRALSLQSGPRVEAFKDAVRLRDQRCVITGRPVDYEDYTGFEAAHIFPLAYEHQWTSGNYGRYISTALDIEIKGGRINSPQNGLLLREDLHTKFDFYKFSINPDDNYKIVFFGSDRDNVAGTYLDQTLLQNPERPADGLLRWHFRQAVLTNMRGMGEPQLEHDFPPGSDMMGEILAAPKAAQRMEFELFSRLGATFKLEN